MKLMATITAVGGDGFYEARTNFGTTCSGVNLMGIGEDIPEFKVGDQVSVYQVNGEFGAFGGKYQSLLELPSGVIQNNKELAALAYIARLVGNTKKMYDTGSVTAIDGKNVKVNDVAMPCAIDTEKLYIGATVMISVLDKKNPRVLGWWNCVPRSSAYKAVRISRIPYSASVDMCAMNYVAGNYDVGSRVILTRFSGYEYVDFGSVENHLNSIDTDDYFYSLVVMRRMWGAAHEEHYVRWHRTDYTVEEITAGEYAALAAVQPAHTKTADDKFWHYAVEAGSIGNCYVSDTVDGDKTLVYHMGFITEPQIWLPVKGHIYKPWV